MVCPNCHSRKHRTLSKRRRPGEAGGFTARVRQCEECGMEWPALEMTVHALGPGSGFIRRETCPAK